MDLATVAAEITRLHDIIAGWFRGEIAPDRFEPDFAERLHPEFENVQPSGHVLALTDLLEPIRSAHGANPDFRIAIEEPRLLATWPASATCLASYVEAQSGARNSAPQNRRRATALFEADGPRLIWRHLHETALPAEAR